MVSATFDGETVKKLYEDDNIIISGSMPPYGIVEAIPAQVQVEGENSLIAYDIKIYANADMMNAGINWQPSAGALTVQVNSNVLENGKTFSIYHMEDADSEPVLVAKAEAADHAITFEAESFSIYPVVEDQDERIAYRFYNGTTLLATEYMRSGRQLYSFGDVGAEYGQSFVGWAYTPDATTAVDNGDMSTLNAHLATGEGDSGNWQTGAPALYAQLNNTTQNPWVATAAITPIRKWSDVKNLTYVNMFAVFQNAYYLRYMRRDDNGSVYVINTVRVLEDAPNKTVTINQQPTSTELQEKFRGWIDVTDLTLYTNGTSITLNRHMDLYEKYIGYNWLVFDSNKASGSSATYTPPQFLNSRNIENIETTTKPADPEMKGYYFTGWNTEKNGSGTSWLTVTRDSNGNVTGYPVNQFGNTLDGDTILYAQWDPAPQNYYVMFWRQASSDAAGLADSEKTYTYVGTETRDSVTGRSVALANTDKNRSTGDFLNCTFNSNLSDTGNVTVNADGTTTLNVYYDLNAYPLTFQVPAGTIMTGTNGTQYGLVNSEFVQVSYSTRYRYWYYTKNNRTYQYEGLRYNSNTWKTYKTITALYGHSIADEFPITWNNGSRWLDYNGTYFANDKVIVSIDQMPPKDITLRWSDPGTRPTKTMNYYVQALEDAGATYNYPGYTSTGISSGDKTKSYSYGGDSYDFVLYDQIKAQYNMVTEAEDFLDITGFTKWTSDPAFVNGVALNDSQNPGTINMYYTRDKNIIHFISEGPNVTARSEKQDDEVYFEASLAPYGQQADGSWYYEPNNGNEGYFFAGWYLDKDCTQEFNFDEETMPAKNITVYAKWATLRTRVVLIPTPNNAHNSEVFFPNDQALKFRKDYGETIDDNNISSDHALRTGYKLEGWYTEPEFIHKWDFSAPVTDKVTGVNPNYQETADWANNTYGDNDGKHTNVSCILKLHAKWTLDVDTTKVYVKYVVPEEYRTYDLNGNLQTTVPIDSNAYSSEAENMLVDIQGEPTGYPYGYDFNGWQLMNPDGTPSEKKYTATGNQYIENFNSYVRTETVTDDDGNTAEMKVIYLQATFVVNAQGDKTTFINFDGNKYARLEDYKGYTNNSAKLHILKQDYLVYENAIVIPDDDSFIIYHDEEPMEGFALVGWSFDNSVTAAQAEAILNGSAQTVTSGNGHELTALEIFEPGVTVYADNEALNGINNENNTLYAIWKRMLPITITKTRAIGTNATAPLEGAEFTVYSDAACTEAVTSKVSGSDGKFTLYLKDTGTYYMKETTVPEGFEENTTLYTIEVTSIGIKVSSTEGDVYSITAAEALSGTQGSYVIKNTPTPENKVDIVVKKVDANNNNGLSGAQFTLYYVQSDGVDALAGTIDFGENTTYTIAGLPSGTYKLVETSAPANYIILNSETKFEVDASEVVKCILVGSNEDASLDSTDPSGQTIIIQNHPIPAPTGIDFRILPYLFMLGAGLALMMGLRYGKKRQMN